MSVLIGNFSEQQYGLYLNPFRNNVGKSAHWITPLNLRNSSVQVTINRIVYAILHKLVYPNNIYLFNQFKSYQFESIREIQTYQAAVEILNKFLRCPNIDEKELQKISGLLANINKKLNPNSNNETQDPNQVSSTTLVKGESDLGQSPVISSPVSHQNEILDDEILDDEILDDGILDDGILDDGILDDGILDDEILENSPIRDPNVKHENTDRSLALIPLKKKAPVKEEERFDDDIIELEEKDRLPNLPPIQIFMATLYPENRNPSHPGSWTLNMTPINLAQGQGPNQIALPIPTEMMQLTLDELQKCLGQAPEINNLQQLVNAGTQLASVGLEKGGRLAVGTTAAVGFNFFSALTAGGAIAGMQATATAGLLTAGGVVAIGAAGAIVTEEVARAIWNGEPVTVAIVQGLKTPFLFPQKLFAAMLGGTQAADQLPVIEEANQQLLTAPEETPAQS